MLGEMPGISFGALNLMNLNRFFRVEWGSGVIGMIGRGRNCAPITTTKATKEVAVKANTFGLTLIGIGLVVLGLILVFLVVPFWLWALLLGVVLILVGFFLIIAG